MMNTNNITPRKNVVKYQTKTIVTTEQPKELPKEICHLVGLKTLTLKF